MQFVRPKKQALQHEMAEAPWVESRGNLVWIKPVVGPPETKPYAGPGEGSGAAQG